MTMRPRYFPAAPFRAWQVLLLGGASGAGKTSISYRLAHHFGVGITEVDDFHVALAAMTTPEQQPVLHYWETHPGALESAAEHHLDWLMAVGRVLAPALEAVIANHLESNAPVILDGDFILPELAARTHFGDEANNGRVRGLFLHEEDEGQFLTNYLAREPERGPQPLRAHVSWRYSQWLQHEAQRSGIPVVHARPWDSVFERVLEVLGG